MPGLVPGIHVFGSEKQVVDGRDVPGHDGGYKLLAISSFMISLVRPLDAKNLDCDSAVKTRVNAL